MLDGVTGSGKTEVYLRAIEAVLERAAATRACSCPEISLTPQTVGRFRARFGDEVAVLHSRLSAGERFDQWDLVRRGEAHIVVGARSALFAPLSRLKLIVIDEEHESSYKQGSAPRYHARDVAEEIAQAHGRGRRARAARARRMEALQPLRDGRVDARRHARASDRARRCRPSPSSTWPRSSPTGTDRCSRAR